MNLYLISQSEAKGYDTYSACVVAAENEKDAANIAPGLYEFGDESGFYYVNHLYSKKYSDPSYSSWASHPDSVEVTFLGIAAEGAKSGIILASFHAG